MILKLCIHLEKNRTLSRFQHQPHFLGEEITYFLFKTSYLIKYLAKHKDSSEHREKNGPIHSNLKCFL